MIGLIFILLGFALVLIIYAGIIDDMHTKQEKMQEQIDNWQNALNCANDKNDRHSDEIKRLQNQLCNYRDVMPQVTWKEGICERIERRHSDEK